MRKRHAARVKVAVLIAATLAFCSPVWSDVQVTTGASNTKKMCYCDCDAKAGSTMCQHMCELAKYENRSWATSCHKAQDNEATKPTDDPASHSRKDNHVQDARL